MILVIDNYDSFVHNLSRYISELGYPMTVVRNDAITISDVDALAPSKIVISPGPCGPDNAGISLKIIQKLTLKVPILGVCLGHQVIGQAFGGRIKRATKPVHGKSSDITHNEKGIFKNISNPLTVGRYHSLIVEKETLPDCLIITAESAEGEIMALSHKERPIFGVQFHPESIMTHNGHALLKNFLDYEN